MKHLLFLFICSSIAMQVYGQSPSFATYMNPVIPGDHPDCNLTRVGNDFYTTGSSFNPTPVIYHSTDLVHWEAIAQPVSAAWANYGDSPSGGCWGGQVVYHNNKFWDYFSRGNVMYFATATDIRGNWSTPTRMTTPAVVPGLGYDNSLFIDDDNTWYLLVKNGQENNWILQLGDDGQPAGKVLNLCWINPGPTHRYSWAEGPVMWKHNGHYYYSFALNVAGGQKVFISDSLTDDQSAWNDLGDFFNLSDPLKSSALFQNPNHASAAVMLDDSTSWVLHPLWRSANSNEWYGQGRQGLLNQVTYDANNKPIADYPANTARKAPKLPSSGIPWMVPHSDQFTDTKLNPEWSFLGYTPANTYSLTAKTGWLTLLPKSRTLPNTVVKNDGEHNYSIITRLAFSPATASDQAGIWVFNGLQTLSARLYSSVDSLGNKIVGFSYKTALYQAPNPDTTNNSIILKLVRVNHVLTGYFSLDGLSWKQVGSPINVYDMENQQANYNAWTGNRQGLFVTTAAASFDYYIYRDAYTPILAECPANQFGTSVSTLRTNARVLDNIHTADWALYAGVEFGNTDYSKAPDSLFITASSGSTGGTVEVWLDSLDSKSKIAECTITNTGSWDSLRTFSARVLIPVSGNHDVYLRFKGSGTDRLFSMQNLCFSSKASTGTGIKKAHSALIPGKFSLEQNYPNPFNPTTKITFNLSERAFVRIGIYDILGRKIRELVNEMKPAGQYSIPFDGSKNSSGIYLCRMDVNEKSLIKRMLLLK